MSADAMNAILLGGAKDMPVEWRRRAQIQVARNSQSNKDCRDLLDMLGLLKEPQ